MSRLRPALALVILAVVVASCGDGDRPSATTNPGAAGTAATTTIGSGPATTAATTAPAAGSADRVTGSVTVTEHDDGRTLAVTVAATVVVQLDHAWQWSALDAEGSGVTVVPVEFESDPGFVAWELRFSQAGTVQVASTGVCTGDGCDDDLAFDLTIDVSEA